MRRLSLLLAPLLLAAACASDGYESVDHMRGQSFRPERQVPSGVTEMREDMEDIRSDTLSRLDQVMGGAPDDSGYWYSPVFDALDFALSWTRLLY